MEPNRETASGKPIPRTSSLYEEFKHFAFKGNVIDLAIAVVIGAAFGKIIESLVKHMIMPLVSVVLPVEHGYLSWKWVVRGKEIPFGLFLGEVANFLLIALVLFFFTVKFLGWLLKAKQEEEAVPPPLTRDQELLIEIRDLLKKREP